MYPDPSAGVHMSWTDSRSTATFEDLEAGSAHQ
jgi:hypothetical protein